MKDEMPYRIGALPKTRKCKRCKCYFFPSRSNQRRCAFCAEKFYVKKIRKNNRGKKCEIGFCQEKQFARGVCLKHYQKIVVRTHNHKYKFCIACGKKITPEYTLHKVHNVHYVHRILEVVKRWLKKITP